MRMVVRGKGAKSLAFCGYVFGLEDVVSRGVDAGGQVREFCKLGKILRPSAVMSDGLFIAGDSPVVENDADAHAQQIEDGQKDIEVIPAQERAVGFEIHKVMRYSRYYRLFTGAALLSRLTNDDEFAAGALSLGLHHVEIKAAGDIFVGGVSTVPRVGCAGGVCFKHKPTIQRK